MNLKIALLLTAMFGIAGLVRLLKADGALPWTVPPKWRPVLAIALGAVGGAVASAVKAAWPAMPITWDQIAEVAIAGPAFSSLLNGLVETAKAAKKDPPDSPVIVKSEQPTAEPSHELVDVPKPPPLPDAATDKKEDPK